MCRFSSGIAALILTVAAGVVSAQTTPQAPSYARVDVAEDNSGFVVNWVDSSDEEDSFSVFRLTTGSVPQFLAKVATGQTNYYDREVQHGVPYAYAIRACIESLCSQPTQTAFLALNMSPSPTAAPPQPTAPPPAPPPTAPPGPIVEIKVNGKESIMYTGEKYMVTWGSLNTQSCMLYSDLQTGAHSVAVDVNTTGSFQGGSLGSYTLACKTLSGQMVSKKVTISPGGVPQPALPPAQSVSPPTAQPYLPPVESIDRDSPVPDYAYSPRELLIPTPINAIVPTDRPMNPPAGTVSSVPPSVIDTIREDRVIERSKENLEKVGRNVRRFEQVIRAEQAPNSPATLNPTLPRIGISDTPKVIASVDALRERGGLDLYSDIDHDGISDYDEVNLYGSDPRNAYTAGDVLSDGERIVRGFDVLSKSAERIPVESPLEAGSETTAIFEVTGIRTVELPVSTGESGMASGVMTADVSAVSSSSSRVERPLVFEGRALPNSFVTLYIFSTPVVVTVKTDEQGNWRYTLDTELPDGNHEMYVAMVNNTGRIVAKSPPVPFVKTAEAVSFVPLTTPPITEPTLIDTLRNNLWVVGAVLLLIFGGIIVGFLGVRKPDAGAPAV